MAHYGNNDNIIIQFLADGVIRVDEDRGRVYRCKTRRRLLSIQRGGYERAVVRIGDKRHFLPIDRIVYLSVHNHIPKDYSIDHMDGNRKNNCTYNLRAVPHTVNLRNRRIVNYGKHKYSSMDDKKHKGNIKKSI